MNYIICQIINQILVPVDVGAITQVTEPEAHRLLAELRARLPAEQFFAVAVLSA